MFQDPKFPNASVVRDVLMMHSMRLLKFHPYIYGVNLRIF